MWRECGPGGSGRSWAGVSHSSEMIEHQFRVHNTTGRDARIVKVVPSCGCTKAVLDQETIPAGAYANLTLQVQAHSVSKNWDIGCRLVSDDPRPKFQNWDYALGFRTYLPVRLTPDPLRFGEVLLKDGVIVGENVQNLTLERYRMAEDDRKSLGSWDVPGFFWMRTHDPLLDLIEGGKVVRSRTKVKLHLRGRASRYAGVHSRTLTYTTSDGDRAEITASWIGTSAVLTSPSSLHFGLLAANGRASKEIRISARDGRRFRIVETVSNDERVEIVRGGGKRRRANRIKQSCAYNKLYKSGRPRSPSRVGRNSPRHG